MLWDDVANNELVLKANLLEVDVWIWLQWKYYIEMLLESRSGNNVLYIMKIEFWKINRF